MSFDLSDLNKRYKEAFTKNICTQKWVDGQKNVNKKAVGLYGKSANKFVKVP